ncbi:type I secretion C-terminal target domain-containing protein, partial [Epibacterium ulvae]|uniref:type I secretion C-terminal target domain-containing protein n=1 Tax=Epibacterium ulvae TaxID=1156985 RepID=UPI001BFC5FB7
DTDTGEITTTAELEEDETIGIATHDLEIEVTDGGLVTETTITVEVHQDDNIILETAPAGELIDGGLGDNDVLQLESFDGLGRTFGWVHHFSNHFSDLRTEGFVNSRADDVLFRAYTYTYEAEIDGETVQANSTNTGGDLNLVRQIANFYTGFEIVSGTEVKDDLSGSLGDDHFFGNGGGDTISTRDGDDILVGGDGYDKLSGGLGADTFVFDSFDGIDTVHDFSLEQGDVLDITALVTGFDADSDDIADFIAFGVNGSGQQTLQISAEGDGSFADVLQFGNNGFTTTLEELVAQDALQFL